MTVALEVGMSRSKWLLGLFTMFVAGPSFGAYVPMNAQCLEKLASGQNRLKVKLPARALRKLARAVAKPALRNEGIALLVDYSKNSKEKRAYVIDFKSCDVLSADYVMHGGAYHDPEPHHDGDPNFDGMLDRCKNRQGTRTNMTRPGLYVTSGCHISPSYKRFWTRIKGDCQGVKLRGLEKTNDDAFNAGVVLHEHTMMTTDQSIKPMGQGCPTFAPGRLQKLLRYGLMERTFVLVHAPQCGS